MEYRIEVSMTPHDNTSKPYFWYIKYRKNKEWYNGGHGWETTPEKAWEAALEYYKKVYC